MPGKIAVVGSGLIGRSWSMIFAGAGYEVSLFDIVPKQIEDARADILVQMKKLHESGLLRGQLSPEQQHANISGSSDLADCLKGAFFVQECVNESLELRTKVMLQIDAVAPADCIISSSSSYIPASAFSKDMKNRHNVLVSHPVNPPYYVPLVELVPAPWTKPEVVARTKELMDEVGQVPVVLKKEIDGFALNRVQVAILMECYRLFQNDIMSAEDIDKVMSAGLGPRYAFMGPLLTTHLNAPAGIVDYGEKYGDSILAIAESLGANPVLKGPLSEALQTPMAGIIPLDKLREGHQWRDGRLAALAKLKKDMDAKDKQD